MILYTFSYKSLNSTNLCDWIIDTVDCLDINPQEGALALPKKNNKPHLAWHV